MRFYTYMLKCADGRFYVGHTDNLEARIAGHQSGIVGGYTKSRRPVELVWYQEFATRYEAIAAERQIKGWSRANWSRAKKQALIAGDWDLISRLAKSRSCR